MSHHDSASRIATESAKIILRNRRLFQHGRSKAESARPVRGRLRLYLRTSCKYGTRNDWTVYLLIFNKFPVRVARFPASSRQFPVRIHGEFCCKPLISTGESAAQFGKSCRNRKFPVFFPVSREMSRGDWFEIDCLHHHAFLRKRSFRAKVPRQISFFFIKRAAGQGGKPAARGVDRQRTHPVRGKV